VLLDVCLPSRKGDGSMYLQPGTYPIRLKVKTEKEHKQAVSCQLNAESFGSLLSALCSSNSSPEK